MPKTKSAPKTVKSIRLSPGSLAVLGELTQKWGTSEAEIITIALDRMYQKEIEMKAKIIMANSELEFENVEAATRYAEFDGTCWPCDVLDERGNVIVHFEENESSEE